MTGPLRRAPRTNAEWARDTARRLDEGENPTSARVGDWVLSSHPDTGALIAAHATGGARQILPVPPPDADPTREDVDTLPSLLLYCDATLSLATDAWYRMRWDTVAAQNGWALGRETAIEEVPVPRTGLYLIVLRVAWTDTDYGRYACGILTAGQPSDVSNITIPIAERGQTRAVVRVVDTVWLNAGETIIGAVYSRHPSHIGIGPEARTMLSMTCLQGG